MKTMAFVTGLAAWTATIGTTAIAQTAEPLGRAVPVYYGHDMMWGAGQWGGFGMVLGPTLMVVVLVGIIAVLIYGLRLLTAPGMGGGPLSGHDRALATLKERFAKGEIDVTDFEIGKKHLAD
ncbi:hypothetical protein LCGC14_2754850 [marine sediment metagenome]|uniref:SHOCT domain-containing protein n=1 Tax=marine sediment metagenome TaxID=412755 RepID=A0A0F9BSB6_9ZZZZ